MKKLGEWWNNYQFNGSSSFVLINKLKLLKNDLMKRNKEVFVEERKKNLVEVIWISENVEESRQWSFDERMRRESIRLELEKVMLIEETRYRQNIQAYG